jgi:hypothetical protein
MKKFLLTITFLAPLLICPVAVFGANDFGLTTAATTGGLSENQISQAGDIPTVLGNIIAIALSLVGVFFFILILYAGIIWMTASGAAERVESAKKKMTSAAIGLVIVLSAYAISNFIFSSLIQEPSVAGDCKAGFDGSVCGGNKVCRGTTCVDECDYLFRDFSGKCINIASDPCMDGMILSGKCSGGSNTKCCVPTSEYKRWEVSAVVFGDETPILPAEEENTCEKQAGYFCATKSACEGVQNGKSSGQNGCPTGEVCCNNCVQRGGNCIDTTKKQCDIETNLKPGFCHGAFSADKYKCCIGTYSDK